MPVRAAGPELGVNESAMHGVLEQHGFDLVGPLRRGCFSVMLSGAANVCST